MNDQEFWALIEASRGHRSACGDAQADALRDILRGCGPEELRAFARTYAEHDVLAHTWLLRGAGYLMNEGMGDDAFDYFCDWLISQGREVFERAIADPDSLADVDVAPGESVTAELFGYAVHDAYDETVGEEMVRDAVPGRAVEPRGKRWDEEELPTLLPRLAAKYGFE